MTSASASRVTRSSRNLRFALAMFAGALAVVTVLRAQETPPAAPAASSPAAPAGTPVPETGTATEAAADAAEGPAGEVQSAPPAAAPTNAPPDSRRPVGPTPGRFEPTEKVRADFDVAFPIDI